jgi:replicative DNA helicase
MRERDSMPPHSGEAEAGLLGCILCAPAECIPVCLEALHGCGDAFFDPRHRALYEQLVAMHDAQQPTVELVLVAQWLRDREMLDAVGGIQQLSALREDTPSPANLKFFLDVVREKHLLRLVLHTCDRLSARVADAHADVGAFLDNVEKEFVALSHARTAHSTKPFSAIAHAALRELEEAHARGGALSGLSTGLPVLDRMTDGWHGGEMIVIAARPSMGKTSLAMNIAEHAAMVEASPVGVFSLEMSAVSLLKRMLCSQAKVNLRSIGGGGFLTENELRRLHAASTAISGANLFLDDSSGLTVMELRAKARRMVQQHGVRLLVIDYLQLLRSDNARAENRQQEIADISNGIKSLAKELDIPVLVLSQLNRDLDREKRRPRLSDLRESGAIEQDADLVAILHRAQEKDDAPVVENPMLPVPVNLLVAKHRNGPTGDVPLLFYKAFTRFEPAPAVEPDDVPRKAGNGAGVRRAATAV